MKREIYLDLDQGLGIFSHQFLSKMVMIAIYIR